MIIIALIMMLKVITDQSRCVATITFFSLVNNAVAAVRSVVVNSLRHVV